ncbi:class I SAM-dependent methyltransferase [Thalassospira marina]|uniref:Methyltransferase type 11 domain-containing protein n=1 Tax=Thalassospira marina TaxID=2048283 RepID=A0ABM6QAX6_9PROT|nr:methyltransferase domain-containing protein [Thalassospira marina]AUG53659.1 hypothetical protein CSC3H3_13755 [Thalassospira marina]
MNQVTGNPVWQDLSSDWLNWADRLAPQADKINRHLIDALELPKLVRQPIHHDDAGLRVLDLASGVGEPAFGIARLLNGEMPPSSPDGESRPVLKGRVTATDIAPGMCHGLAVRAAQASLANLDVVAADMQKLPFANGAFDAVSCRFGIMFCDDADLALRECLRVLALGGRAAFMLWGPMAENPLFMAMDQALRDVLGIGFTAAGLDPFGFASPETSVARLINAGFEDVSLVTHVPRGRIPQAARFWRPQMEMLFGPHMRKADAAAQKAIDERMHANLSQHIEDAHFRVPMCFHILSGSRGIKL